MEDRVLRPGSTGKTSITKVVIMADKIDALGLVLKYTGEGSASRSNRDRKGDSQ